MLVPMHLLASIFSAEWNWRALSWWRSITHSHSPAPLHCCENTLGTKTLQIKLAAVLLLILQSPWGTRTKPPLVPIQIKSLLTLYEDKQHADKCKTSSSPKMQISIALTTCELEECILHQKVAAINNSK